MNPILQNAINLSAEPGEIIAPAILLAAINSEDNPVAALSDPDRANAFFNAFNGDFPFLRLHMIQSQALTITETERLSGLIRWLVLVMRTWEKTADPQSNLLVALFVTLQSLRAEKDFWQHMPAEIGANTELLDTLVNFITRSQFEFSTRGYGAVPIWEGEALEKFKEADQNGDWVEIGRNWHLFANAIWPSFLYTQALACLAHYGFNQLVRAANGIRQTMKAMVIADTLDPDTRLRLAKASQSPYVEFACVYCATATLHRPVPPAPADFAPLVAVLAKVSTDKDRWAAWMQTFNHWPTRFPSIHAPLGEALALVSDEALRSYIASINLHVISDVNAEGRRLVADCLRTFRIHAEIEKRQYFWTLGYEKWADWNFNPGYSEQISKICWSVLDYAVSGYLIECLSDADCRTVLGAILQELSGIDETWHVFVSDCITAWNRLLSKYQQYAHAITARETGEDWISTNKEYWPFEKRDAKYHCKMFNID